MGKGCLIQRCTRVTWDASGQQVVSNSEHTLVTTTANKAGESESSQAVVWMARSFGHVCVVVRMARALPSAATSSAELSLFVATTSPQPQPQNHRKKMQSESLKKTFRRFLPASSSDVDQLDCECYFIIFDGILIDRSAHPATSLDSAPSESIGGDTTIGATEASFGVWKEASALVAKVPVPYISALGHLINRVLTIRDASV